MALNIKNEETQKLAKELAKLTGESMTAAVTEALRERLDRVRGEHGVGLADRLLKIGKDCAAHLREPFGPLTTESCCTTTRDCHDDYRYVRDRRDPSQ